MTQISDATGRGSGPRRRYAGGFVHATQRG